MFPFDTLDDALHVFGQCAFELEAYHVVDDAQGLVCGVGMYEVAEGVLHVDVHEDVGERLHCDKGGGVVPAIQHNRVDGLRDNEVEQQFGQRVLELPEGEVSAPDDGYAVGPHAGPHVEGEHDNKGEYESFRRGEERQHGAEGRHGDDAPLFPVEYFVHNSIFYFPGKKVHSAENPKSRSQPQP